MWQAIETAPKDGTHIDLWAKCWHSYYDDFVYQRFTDCYWSSGDRQANLDARWINIDENWHATHWMPVPAGSEEVVNVR